MVSKIPFSLNGDLNTGEVVEPNTVNFLLKNRPLLEDTEELTMTEEITLMLFMLNAAA